MSQTVSSGPYRFFTYTELVAEQTRYKSAVQSAGSDLQSGTQNGQTLAFGPRRDWTLEEWGDHLATALAMLRPGQYQPPAPRRSVTRFY
jgi:catalase (peroxidase I)